MHSLFLTKIGIISVLSKNEIVDDRKNVISVCRFESFLAKYFLEHPEVFDALKDKILTAIEKLVELNSKNTVFGRLFYSVFSCLLEQEHPITNLKAVKESRSLVMFDTFLKYFIERVMTITDIVLPSLKEEETTASSSTSEATGSALQKGGMFTLFKMPLVSSDLLLAKMRPEVLFSDKNRGVVTIEDEDSEYASRSIGILSPKDTPAKLENYLKFPNYPSRQYYLPKEDSEMARWLRAHYLPVISGASGGIGKTISGLAKLMSFSSSDYMFIGLLIASSTIALGHHSFFEVIRPISFVIDCIEEQTNLLAFYEQVIPQEIKVLESYKEHMKSEEGASLIEGIFFEPECDSVPPVGRLSIR